MTAPEQEEFVVLTVVKDANLAEMIRIALANEDIPCIIEGEHQAGMTGVFPIRIVVRAEHLEQAREIASSHDDSLIDDSP